MTLEELSEYCLNYNNVYKDFPFKKKQDYCVIRHRLNKKMFALIFIKDNNTWVNLKTEPELGYFLKQTYEAVVPAYHMNKEHWISVILDGSIDKNEIFSFVDNSYALTKPRVI